MCPDEEGKDKQENKLIWLHREFLDEIGGEEEEKHIPKNAYEKVTFIHLLIQGALTMHQACSGYRGLSVSEADKGPALLLLRQEGRW